VTLGHLPFAVAAWLFLVGLYGLATGRHLVHQCLCLIVVQSSTYVLLAGIGYRTAAQAPIFDTVPVGTPAVDPVVHALMLTDIVVEATVAALLLALIVRLRDAGGSVEHQDGDPLKG
jgi:multicomponent Na+:H+ antiporter subunit C